MAFLVGFNTAHDYRIIKYHVLSAVGDDVRMKKLFNSDAC